jgi:hypothetical protein
MSVVPVDELPGGAGFWPRLAQALDTYLVGRSRRVVPAAALRRSKHDINRCRRLMHRGAAMTALASESRRFART